MARKAASGAWGKVPALLLALACCGGLDTAARAGEDGPQVNVLRPLALGTYAGDALQSELVIAPDGANSLDAVNLDGFAYEGLIELVGEPEAWVSLTTLGADLESDSGDQIAVRDIAFAPSDFLQLDATGRAQVRIGTSLSPTAAARPGRYEALFQIEARYDR